MKKLSFFLLSLALLLLVGVFSVKAITQSAYETTNFGGFNFDSYVQGDVYKWIYDTSKGCIKVKQSSLSTNQEYYESETKCKDAHKASAYSYSGTNLGGLNFDNSNLYSNTPTPKTTPKYTTTDQGINSSFNLSFEDTKPKTNTSTYQTTDGSSLGLSGFGNQTAPLAKSNVDTTGKVSWFGTDVEFNSKTNTNLQSTTPKVGVSGFFNSLITSLGFKESAAPITPQGGETPPEPGEGDGEEIDGTIAFTVSPSKTYAKGETIKIKVTKKPKVPTNYDFNFWYDLKVDWKNTPDNTSDDIMKEANAIAKDEFEIKTDGYYRMEITLKASTTGPSPKYEYKEYESKSVALTLDEQKKEGIDTIKNDCYLDIIDFKPSINGKIGFTADKPEAITVTFKLNCTSFDKKYFDVKPLSVSAYIDVPALKTFDKDKFECETKPFTNKELYKEGTEYTVSCTKEKVTEALKKESNDDTRNRFLMVDMYYFTNKKTGTNYGEEHEERFISTRDKVPISSTPTDPGDKEQPGDGKTIKLEVVLNPASTDPRTFKDCKGGTVKVIWSSTGYDTCSISSDTLVYIEGSGKEGTKEFTVGKNTISHHTITLTCKYLKDNVPTKVQEKVQINIPKCEGEEGGTDTDKEESIQEKCNKTECTSQFGLGTQVILKYNNNKIINSTDLKFQVKLGGSTCDLNVFQKTFARIKIDGKIIQDITVPANTKERTYTIGNIWNKLSEQTQKNISDRLQTYDGVDINIALESWSTFDETKGKTWNCNWKPETVVKVTFVKQTVQSGASDSTDKVAKCKEQCKKDFDNLSESDMIAAYGGNSRGQAYENCIAKCEGKDIPNKTTVAKTSDKCSTKLTPKSNLFDIDSPINIGVTLSPNKTGQVIRSMRGVILENSQLKNSIDLGTKNMGGNYSATEEIFSKTLPEQYLVRSNPKNALKVLIDNSPDNKITVPIKITTWVGERNSSVETICDEQTTYINLTSKTITEKQTCEFSVYGGQTLQLLRSQNGDFRNVDYQDIPALVLYPYGNVTNCNKNMSNFNFELIWDQKTSDVQKFSAVDCSKSCFKQLAYKFDRSKANVFAQKALENKGQSIYAGKLTIKLVNTKDSTFTRTYTQNIFFRYPPGQPVGSNTDVPIAKNICTNGYPKFTYGYTYGNTALEKSENFTITKPKVASSLISSALKLDFKGCNDTKIVTKATVTFLDRTGSILINSSVPNILWTNSDLVKQSTLQLCFDKDGKCNYNCIYYNNGETTTLPKCTNPN